ncbi:interleukin-5 receptor subunit alpha-like isoform X1 [Enoplosus armatus]|uniref:interleukin-5 receptor subunit alpha-like isoform X1 n=1 Tax=Enoplosus armatus TaxID=215367 RepID=UPI0039944134
MKLFPVLPIFWSSLLVLWASQSEVEANNPDPNVCQGEKTTDDLWEHSSSVQRHHIEDTEVDGNFLCVLYPTNILNCSWSFNTLQKDTQLFVYISICDDERAVHSLHHSSGERVGSRSVTLREYQMLHVILHFNITQHDKWIVYTYTYERVMLEVLSPPQNVSASIKDGGLLVTWGLPRSREYSNPSCFEYQLDMGDQERPKNLTGQLSFLEQNADPCRTYRVRMRTKKMGYCLGSPQWSDWSHTVTVEPSVYRLNTLVIVSISLGIPMILLAVLLLVRHQRVSEVLFPPIPRPPPKYKCFLEKNDTSNLFHLASSAEPEAEITEVEDTEENPGKTF